MHEDLMTWFKRRSENPSCTYHFSNSFNLECSVGQGAMCWRGCPAPHQCSLCLYLGRWWHSKGVEPGVLFITNHTIYFKSLLGLSLFSSPSNNCQKFHSRKKKTLKWHTRFFLNYIKVNMVFWASNNECLCLNTIFSYSKELFYSFKNIFYQISDLVCLC